MARAADATWREVWWWVKAGCDLTTRHPGQLLVAFAALWLASPFLEPAWLALGILVAVATRGLALAAPVAFHRYAVAPVRGLVARTRLRRCWREVAVACGLAVTKPARQSGEEPVVLVPELVRVTSDDIRATLRLRLPMGQTIDDVVTASEAIRSAVAATHVRVEPHLATDALVTLTLGDVLTAPFNAEVLDVMPSRAPETIPMGRMEDGRPWSLPVGPHTLVAGSSGAGKGSIFWSFAFGLAPSVRTGLVHLHGIDLKGGMEILMGSQLFSTRATNAAEAVASLESLVVKMRDRTRRYAGRLRSHASTAEEPLHVVMIDELAALTAYQPERDLQRRAEMAINLLCSQGRAVGFVVFACLQDPRKEVIPSRGLFTQMIGLRLKDATETAMVLGDLALASGAHCHRIDRAAPGTGYVVPDHGGHPVRVRAGFASDAAIRFVAKEFPTPMSEEVPPLRPAESSTRARSKPSHDLGAAS